jgi:hypothetical protein
MSQPGEQVKVGQRSWTGVVFAPLNLFTLVLEKAQECAIGRTKTMGSICSSQFSDAFFELAKCEPPRAQP